MKFFALTLLPESLALYLLFSKTKSALTWTSFGITAAGFLRILSFGLDNVEYRDVHDASHYTDGLPHSFVKHGHDLHGYHNNFQLFFANARCRS